MSVLQYFYNKVHACVGCVKKGIGMFSDPLTCSSHGIKGTSLLMSGTSKTDWHAYKETNRCMVPTHTSTVASLPGFVVFKRITPPERDKALEHG